MKPSTTNVAEIESAKIEAQIAELESANIDAIITIVHQQLKSKRIHPAGSFGKLGCWYTKQNEDLISVRAPSRNHPYSENTACRSKKYVKKVCKKYNCKTVEQLKSFV